MGKQKAIDYTDDMPDAAAAAREQTVFSISGENLGPVKTVEIQVRPGVNVLHGGNGTGKSTVLDAVQYALTKSGPKPTPRDGTRAGRVEAFGVTCTFSSRATTKGTLEVEALSGKLDLGDLIDPGYEDPDIADKHRIRKLIDLSGAQADAEQFCALVGEWVPGSVPTDLIDAADWAKKELQERAREAEDRAAKHKAAAQAARDSAAGVDLSAPCDSQELQHQLSDATQRRMRLTAEMAAAETSRKKADAARQALETLGSDADAAEYQSRLEASAAALREAERVVRAAEDALTKAREKLVSAKRAMAVDQQGLQEAQARAEQRRRAEQALAAVVEGPSEAELADADAAILVAREAMELGALVRKAKEQTETAYTRDLDAASATKRAVAYREKAASTDDLLAAELQRIGCPWRPKDIPCGKGTERRLVTKHRRGDETLVGDLSAGERARDAIDVALGLAGKSDRPAVLILRQEVYEGLQPRVQAEIDKHAAERGVVILTAKATDDNEVTA